MALLQPAPEVYDLFDDIMLLCEGGALPLLQQVARTEQDLPPFGSAEYWPSSAALSAPHLGHLSLVHVIFLTLRDAIRWQWQKLPPPKRCGEALSHLQARSCSTGQKTR